MFVESPRFPDQLAWGARGGPQWSTSIVGLLGGQEQRNQNWRFPLVRYEVGLVNRDRAMTELLFSFFRTVAMGKTNGFRFRDPLPGEAEGTGETLGNADGSRATYPLVKTYTLEGFSLVRRILKPVVGTVMLTIGDTPVDPASYSVDHTTGVVTFAAPPTGGILLGTFQFDVPVRFDTDVLRMQRLDPNAWSWDSIPLIEVRNPL